MKKYFFIIIILFFNNALIFSQSIGMQVIANSGGHFQNGGYSLSWTMGELVTETLDNSYILTQGFQQSFFTVVEIENIEKNENFNVKLYPNPTSKFLNISFSEDEKENEFFVELIDLQGRILKSFNILENFQKINLEDYPEGMYFLRIYNSKNYTNEFLKTYKIQKLF